jgi:DNA-binding beta-propeller fold protein YncE
MSTSKRVMNSNMTRLFTFALVVFISVIVDAGPVISNIAGTGEKGASGDAGPADRAQLNNPSGLASGPDGALYVCDTSNHAIRRIDGKTGVITTVAGTLGKKGYAGDGGPATAALMNEPYEVRFDRSGNMFIVERLNHVIRRVDGKTGVISTFAGNGKSGFGGDGGPATAAAFNQPHAIGFSPEMGGLFVCDIANHRVRVIEMRTGNVSTYAGTGQKKPTPDGAKIEGTPLSGPRALDFDAAGNLWLALREGNSVYRIELRARTVHHEAGTGKTGFTGNGGPAKEATLSGPKGLAIHPKTGNVYLADTESHSIRMIDTKSGNLELVAGTGAKGDGPDGEPTKCQLARPHGVFVDGEGAIYIGDSENHRVRVIRVK